MAGQPPRNPDTPTPWTQIIQRSFAEVGNRYNTEAWVFSNDVIKTWEIDQKHLEAGTPSMISTLTTMTNSEATRRWARAMLEPDTAVILDTETVGSDTETKVQATSACEIAVIDAYTGEPLLNTLVNPETHLVRSATPGTARHRGKEGPCLQQQIRPRRHPSR